MSAKIVLTGVIIVLILSLLVFMLEFFIPIAAKSDMNTYCRSKLLKMEIQGGLTQEEKDDLQQELELRGFTGISINSTSGAKQGQEIALHVEADFTYSKLSGILTRTITTKHMIYSKTAIVRKVVN